VGVWIQADKRSFFLDMSDDAFPEKSILDFLEKKLSEPIENFLLNFYT